MNLLRTISLYKSYSLFLLFLLQSILLLINIYIRTLILRMFNLISFCNKQKNFMYHTLKYIFIIFSSNSLCSLPGNIYI